ncbi:MAG TPA: response regulator transcription factor [Gaiellaceae bacterium]|nr:response regulator transcription factor [Gaiellaceae bacterium]
MARARRILIVDDDARFCALVADVLSRDGHETLIARTGEAAIELLSEIAPDVLVLDVQLPGISGYEVLHKLRARGDDTPVVFVSGVRVEPLDRVAGLLLGADDYVVKPFAPDELLGRVRSLLRRRGTASSSLRGLTRRETEVLLLLADGWTQKQIAAALVVSPRTVGSHIERILEKLDVHTRAQAIAVAYSEGVIPVRHAVAATRQ